MFGASDVFRIGTTVYVIFDGETATQRFETVEEAEMTKEAMIRLLTEFGFM